MDHSEYGLSQLYDNVASHTLILYPEDQSQYINHNGIYAILRLLPTPNVRNKLLTY